MPTSFNPAPKSVLHGIQDKSQSQQLSEALVSPTHFPLLYLYTQKGPLEPMATTASTFSSMYGKDTLNVRSNYYNHHSVLATILNSAGNSFFVQRLKPNDAADPSRLLLSLDVVTDQIQQYQRNSDGSFLLNTNGEKIPITGAGATVTGTVLKWVLNQWTAGNVVQDFGQVQTRVGSMVSSTGTQSTLYPIHDFQVPHFGSYGNNNGLNLTAPTTASNNPINTDLVDSINAYMFRLKFLSRDTPTSTANTVKSISGDQYIDFTYKPNTINVNTDALISANDIIINSYNSVNDPSVTPVYGPFGSQHIYQDNLKTILALIGQNEAAYGTLPVTSLDINSDYLYMVNPVTCTNPENVPYYSTNLLTSSSGGIIFTDNTILYAAGGSDGTMDFSSFDELVRNQLTNFGSIEGIDILDDARYPISAIYDTGFTIDTKLAFAIPMSLRKDIGVVVSTQDVSLPPNDGATETSINIRLKNAFQNYPESELYGTGVSRAFIIGNCGYLTNSDYKKLVPLTVEYAYKNALFMGAGNGIWKKNFAYDDYPNNVISLFNNVNVVYKPEDVRDKDWANGLNFPYYYDMKSLYWPALQSIYTDPTSVLKSAINVWLCIEIEKVCQRAFRDLSGKSSLTSAQFIEKSNQIISDKTNNRFAGRAIIKPRTYFTAIDNANKYSWSCSVDVYMPDMKYVGNFTVVANNIDDYTATN